MDSINNAMTEDDPFLPVLLIDPTYDDEVVFRINTHLKYGPDSYIYALARMPPNAEISKAISNLIRFYPHMTKEEVRRFIEEICNHKRTFVIPNEHKTEITVDGYVNTELMAALRRILEILEGYATIPRWIAVGFKYDGNLPLYPDDDGIFDDDDPTKKTIKLPSRKKAVDLLLNDIAKYMLPGDEKEETLFNVKSQVNEMYSESRNILLKLRLLQPIYIERFLDPAQKDVERNQLYGPANPYIFEGKSYDDRSCRMFTSFALMSMDDIDELLYQEDEIRPFDWFTGNCYICSKKIREYWHAVRMPLEGGGWDSCYCSWECVIKDLPKAAGESDAQFAPGPIRRRFIKYFSGIIMKMEIYDRESPEEEVDVSISQLEKRIEYVDKMSQNPKAFNREFEIGILSMGLDPVKILPKKH